MHAQALMQTLPRHRAHVLTHMRARTLQTLSLQHLTRTASVQSRPRGAPGRDGRPGRFALARVRRARAWRQALPPRRLRVAPPHASAQGESLLSCSDACLLSCECQSAQMPDCAMPVRLLPHPLP